MTGNVRQTARLYLAILILASCVLTGCAAGVGVGSIGTNGGGSSSNRSPIINQFTANPTNQVNVGQPVSFQVTAQDLDGDALQYTWSATGGALSTTTGSLVSWSLSTAPASDTIYIVQVVVIDGKGGSASGSVNLTARASGTVQIGNPATNTPSISSLNPDSGPVGTGVTITGSQLTGANSVTFNGVNATFTVNSDTQITTTVPNGATTGSVKVTTGGGVSNGVTFTVTSQPQGSVVTTVAGTGQAGFTNGQGSLARFSYPTGIVVDSFGNLYVADNGNHAIRKIDASGAVTVLAGSGSLGFSDGSGSAAQFYFTTALPAGLARDAAGNLYVGDTLNNRIRKINQAGVVSTLAGNGNWGGSDGSPQAASFKYPCGVAVDSAGNVYVADAENNKIRKIDPAGNTTTLAGTGEAGFLDGFPGTAARFNTPRGVAVDSSGNVFVGDTGNHRIRKILPNGTVSTLAGSGASSYEDGVGVIAKFSQPTLLAVDSGGNVFILDSGNQRIRKVTHDGTTTTVAGSGTAGFQDGPALSAQFYFGGAGGITVDSAGNLYAGDTANHRIRKVSR